MRKASEVSDVNLTEGLHGKMCMPLRVAESTLIRPRNITTTLHFRLRGLNNYEVETGTSVELRGIDGLQPS